MSSPQDGKDETILITLRMPKSLLEVVDRAVELGYFPNRSEAIREALRRLLKSLLFTLEPINVIEQRIKKNPPKRTMPPEVYFMKYALDYITEAPEAEDLFTDYTEFITLTTALLKSGKKEELKEFIKILKEVLK